jgi:hypothetical protein
LALSYSVLDASRHPSQGGSCVLCEEQEESANKDTVVAQSQGANPVALVLWNMLMARTNRPNVAVGERHAANSSSSAFASFRSSVSNPSVNQP